jgi:hypothetical protein
MNLKTLLFGVLITSVLASCTDRLVDTNEYNAKEELPTYASLTLNLLDPATYAGSASELGAAEESVINDVAVFVYKLDGTPEATAYVTPTDFSSQNNTITLKVYSGEKLIYLATNIGGNKLINHGYSNASTSNAANNWSGIDWTDPSTPGITFATLNAPVWSAGESSTAILATGTSTATVSDGLIKALINNGDASLATGFPAGTNGTGYFMSNWGDADTQSPDINGIDDYAATVKFTLLPQVSASDSRAAAADATNTNGKNALLINIQRALAKISISVPSAAILNNAGSGSGAGVFVPDAKWAVGNINMSFYPFQMFDGDIVKSTRYNDTASIIDPNWNWKNKMDNSRWIPAGKSYDMQNLTVSEVVAQINNNPNNVPFGTDRVLITENNNKNTFNAYSTFILVSGQYKPNSYITTVSNAGAVTTSNVFPTSWPATVPQGGTTDTMYYVQSIGNSGTFFLGIKALQEYLAYTIYNIGAAGDPYTNNNVNNYINNLKITHNGSQSDLQAYWHGYCFYRGWIRDQNAVPAAGKILVRRNHIYSLDVNAINGPGIGDPNDIIDPDPYPAIPVQEMNTYLSASINIMKWHIINQGLVFQVD